MKKPENRNGDKLVQDIASAKAAAIAGGKRYYNYAPCGYGYYYSVPSYAVRRNSSFEVAASRLDSALF